MESGLRVRRGAEAGGRVRASLRSTAFEVWLRSGRVNGVEDEGQLSRMSWILMMVNRQQEDESKKRVREAEWMYILKPPRACNPQG